MDEKGLLRIGEKVCNIERAKSEKLSELFALMQSLR